MRKLIVLLILLVLALAAWSLYQQSTHHQTPGATGSAVTGALVLVHKAGPSSLYPDQRLTRGDILTADAAVVCAPGYAKSVRHVSQSEKLEVYREYGVSYPQARGAYEVDHFIPLELGGSNEIINLWLEPADPEPGFHEKDAVENYLHAQVCVTKTISLAEAQREIRTDWYAVYLRIPK
jgi:hypothetical protein